MPRSWFVSTILLVTALPMSAAAVGHTVSKDRFGIDRSEVLIANDGTRTTMTVRVRATTQGQPAALIFGLQAPVDESSLVVIEKPTLLDPLRAQTAPKFVVVEANDPCAEEAPKVETGFAFPEDAPPLSAKYEITQSPLNTLDAALKKRGLSLDDGVKKKLARVGTAAVIVFVTPNGRQRDRWTAAFQWRVADVAPIDLTLGADATPNGREHLVSLFTIHPTRIVRPTGPMEKLPGPVALAEVSFETPRDTASAVVRHTLRRSKTPGWVMRHVERRTDDVKGLGGPSGAHVIARFYTVATRKAPALALAEEAYITDFVPTWRIRRKWRKPTTCALPRQANIVRIEETAELRAFSAMTGRTFADIAERTKQRGYAQLPDGSLKPVKPKPAPNAVPR